eukprot:14968084-Alexandrium_andersonii.AAC.1
MTEEARCALMLKPPATNDLALQSTLNANGANTMPCQLSWHDEGCRQDHRWGWHPEHPRPFLQSPRRRSGRAIDNSSSENT